MTTAHTLKSFSWPSFSLVANSHRIFHTDAVVNACTWTRKEGVFVAPGSKLFHAWVDLKSLDEVVQAELKSLAQFEYTLRFAGKRDESTDAVAVSAFVSTKATPGMFVLTFDGQPDYFFYLPEQLDRLNRAITRHVGENELGQFKIDLSYITA